MKKPSYAIFAALLCVLLLLTTACGAKDDQNEPDVTKKRKATTTAEVTGDASKILSDAIKKMRATTSFCETTTEKTKYNIENETITSTVNSETRFIKVGENNFEFSQKTMFEGTLDAGELCLYYKDGVEYLDFGDFKYSQPFTPDKFADAGIILNNLPDYTSFFGKITAVTNGSEYTITASNPNDLGKAYFSKLFGSDEGDIDTTTLSDLTAVFETDDKGYIVKTTFSAVLTEDTLNMTYNTELTSKFTEINKIKKIDFPDLSNFPLENPDDDGEWG